MCIAYHAHFHLAGSLPAIFFDSLLRQISMKIIVEV